MASLQLTSDPAADSLLSEDPFALLVGMLLDQQIPMEVAFAGPRKIADRLGGIDAAMIAKACERLIAANPQDWRGRLAAGDDGGQQRGRGARDADACEHACRCST